MSIEINEEEKLERVLGRDPQVTIFLRPIAPPAALGLAGFAGSTFITASYIAGWWGDESSPTIFFPFVMIWGGLGQFIAGFFGYHARDTLVTVVHVLWGSFWLGFGLLSLLIAAGAIPPHSVYGHWPELASWMVVMAFFTWSCAIASIVRDLVLFAVLTTLAIGSTIAICWYAYGDGVGTGLKVGAYFWIVSSILAWWRVTVFLMEEAFGHGKVVALLPVFRMPPDRKKPLMVPGFGEPGVKRAMPGVY